MVLRLQQQQIPQFVSSTTTVELRKRYNALFKQASELEKTYATEYSTKSHSNDEQVCFAQQQQPLQPHENDASSLTKNDSYSDRAIRKRETLLKRIQRINRFSATSASKRRKHHQLLLSSSSSH